MITVPDASEIWLELKPQKCLFAEPESKLLLFDPELLVAPKMSRL